MGVAPYFWSIDVIRRIGRIRYRLIVMRSGGDAEVVIRSIVVGRRCMRLVGLVTDGEIILVRNGRVRGGEEDGRYQKAYQVPI